MKNENRQYAKQHNLRTYIGKPCDKHGNVERLTNRASCIECVKENKRLNRNKEVDNLRRKNSYHNKEITLDHWVRRAMTYAKARAKKQNVPFDLDKEYLLSIWTGICPVFGHNLSFNNTGRTNPPNQATIDKIIPQKGYVKGNVKFLSYRANMLKSNGSIDEISKVVEWMKSVLS